jgi:hypothetical protein
MEVNDYSFENCHDVLVCNVLAHIYNSCEIML